MITGKGFTIENLYPTIAKIHPIFTDKEYTGFDGNFLVLDFGHKTKEDILETSFILRSKDLKIVSTSASCGCTTPSFKAVNPGEYMVTVTFDKNKLSQNVSKTFSLQLNINKSIRVNLIINKV